MTYTSACAYDVVKALYDKYGLDPFWHKIVKEDLGDVIAIGLKQAKISGYIREDGKMSSLGNGVHRYRLSAKAFQLLKVDMYVCRGTNS